MDLPSFLWLWRIAAWSMGLSLLAYSLLLISGIWMFYHRQSQSDRPFWLMPFHYIMGGMMVYLVLLLLGIGIVGTIGHYGSLGHSSHLVAGLLAVVLVLGAAISGLRIHPQRPQMRSLHIGTNFILLFGYLFVTVTGWVVVQKYLP